MEKNIDKRFLPAYTDEERERVMKAVAQMTEVHEIKSECRLSERFNIKGSYRSSSAHVRISPHKPINALSHGENRAPT